VCSEVAGHADYNKRMKSEPKTSQEFNAFSDALKTVLKVSPAELKDREKQWKKEKAAKRAKREKTGK